MMSTLEDWEVVYVSPSSSSKGAELLEEAIHSKDIRLTYHTEGENLKIIITKDYLNRTDQVIYSAFRDTPAENILKWVGEALRTLNKKEL